MFQSRQKSGFLEKVSAFFWPKSGWRRSTKYVAHRVARLPGTPYSIAAGFASGAAISFTPFVGGHFIGGAIWALLVRGNVLASAIGTAVGNPWTFPFIWIFIYRLGLWMGAGDGTVDENLDFIDFFAKLVDATAKLDFNFVLETAWPVFWPMLLGSIPTAIATWFIFFFPVRYFVHKYHMRRIHRRAKRKVATVGRHEQ